MYNRIMPLRVPVPAQPAQEFITGFMGIMCLGVVVLSDVGTIHKLLLLVAAGVHFYLYRKVSRRELSLWHWSPVSLGWMIIFLYSLGAVITVL